MSRALQVFAAALQVAAFAVPAIGQDHESIDLAACQGRAGDGVLEQRRSLARLVAQRRIAAEGLHRQIDLAVRGRADLVQVARAALKRLLPSTSRVAIDAESSTSTVQFCRSFSSDVHLPLQAAQHRQQDQQHAERKRQCRCGPKTAWRCAAGN